MNITVTFYTACILNNSSYRTNKQNDLVYVIVNRDNQKSSLEHGNANFTLICFIFVMKGGYGFRRFNCNRELIPDC